MTLGLGFLFYHRSALCVPRSVFGDDVHIGKWIIKFYTICSFHLSSSLSLSLHSCFCDLRRMCNFSSFCWILHFKRYTRLVNWTKCRARVVEILEFLWWILAAMQQWKKDAGHSEKFTLLSHLTRWTNTIYSPRITRWDSTTSDEVKWKWSTKKIFMSRHLNCCLCSLSLDELKKMLRIVASCRCRVRHTRDANDLTNRVKNAGAAKRRNENVENILSSFFFLLVTHSSQYGGNEWRCYELRRK